MIASKLAAIVKDKVPYLVILDARKAGLLKLGSCTPDGKRSLLDFKPDAVTNYVQKAACNLQAGTKLGSEGDAACLQKAFADDEGATPLSLAQAKTTVATLGANCNL